MCEDEDCVNSECIEDVMDGSKYGKWLKWIIESLGLGANLVYFASFVATKTLTITCQTCSLIYLITHPRISCFLHRSTKRSSPFVKRLGRSKETLLIVFLTEVLPLFTPPGTSKAKLSVAAQLVKELRAKHKQQCQTIPERCGGLPVEVKPEVLSQILQTVQRLRESHVQHLNILQLHRATPECLP